jgi:alcohol dehydrogenase
MEGTMKALCYFGKDDIQLVDIPMPKIIEKDDIIVKVTLSTICASDVHIKDGHLPLVKPETAIGHEFVGQVVEAGPDVTSVKIGDRVAVNCITSCGECFYCKQGFTSHCENGGWFYGYQEDGCQAEYVRVRFANNSVDVVKIPDSLSDKDVLFTGDILHTGYFGAENGNIKPDDTVVVFGAGPVGMCAMLTARLFGPAKIIAVDTNDSRLDVALKNKAADLAFNPIKDDVVQKVKDLTEGRGADVAIEAAGVKPTFDSAIDVVRPSGTISIIALYAQPQALQMQEITGKNLTIKMGWVHSTKMKKLIDLIANGVIDTKFLQTHEAPLNDIVKGYDIFGGQKDGCLKWLVTPYQK